MQVPPPIAPAMANPLAQALLAATSLSGPSSNNTLNELILVEMNNILQQMYIDMNVSNPLSLDQIAIANPTLYAQLRSQAEANFQAVIGNNANPQQIIQPPPSSSSNYNNNARKRPGDFQQTSQPARSSNRQPGRSGQSTRSNHSGSNTSTSHSTIRSSSLPPAPPTLTIPIAPPTTTSMKTNSVTLPPAPKNAVHGFVSEASVVIDVDRVKLVTDSLTNYNNNPSSIPFPDSDKLVQLSGSLLQRLEDYVDSIKVPPKLPQALLSGMYHFLNFHIGVHQINLIDCRITARGTNLCKGSNSRQKCPSRK